MLLQCASLRILPLVAFALAGLGGNIAIGAEEQKDRWVPLFNGKDLDSWTPKITKHELGENFGNTFRVEEGLLKVSYDGYENFDGQYGHLFYKDKFSNYRLRVEYRFVGEQAPGGPGWAIRNSGVMFHCQSPDGMRKDQDFPVSIEAQMLGGDGEHERTTGNVCTPGTHLTLDGKLIKRHCTSSTSKTFAGEQWVTMELEVHGGGVVKHIVEGETVLEYERPQLDPADDDAKRLAKPDGDLVLQEGYISLQSESHPVEFRKIEILVLDE